MHDTPTQASAVIIGGGLAGSSLAHHLSRLGWTDLVLVDREPMPGPDGASPDGAGSDGLGPDRAAAPAPGFACPAQYAKMMMALTRDSMAQYAELGVFTRTGGIEVARTEARLAELRRRCSAARAWGIPAELLSPAQAGKLVPVLDETVVLGAAHFPTAGLVDAVRAGALMREQAEQLGALRVLAGTEVLGIATSADGRVSGVRTSEGEIRTEVCAICCGVSSPRVAAMAGARIPLVPLVVRIATVGPAKLPDGAAGTGESGYPFVLDPDAGLYQRLSGGLEIGWYPDPPVIVGPDDEPASPDLGPQLERARDLMPSVLPAGETEPRSVVHELIAMTPDGYPVLGEAPEVPGLWPVAGGGIQAGAGLGRAAAEWISGVTPRIDVRRADIARFYSHQRTRAHAVARASEGFGRICRIVHPAEPWQSGRPLRLSPVYHRERELGAVFTETAGWERPAWYAANEGLLERYAGRLMEREAEWDSRWWSPVINAEHLAMREHCGLADLTALAVFDVTGPGALAALQSLAVAQLDVAAGRVVRTPMLDESGGLRADLTVMRLGPRRFRVVSGPVTGMSDLKWISDHLPDDGRAAVADLTSAWATLGLWGPRARDVLAAVTEADVSAAGFGLGTCRELEIGGVTVLASRTCRVGELGWELHAPIEQGARLWDTLWEAGRPHHLTAVGAGVYDTTGRLEKSHRAFGTELDSGYNLAEAGLDRSPAKPQNFLGRAVYLGQRAAGPCALLCTLTVDDHRSADGQLRYMLGGEPVLTPEGEPLADAKGRPSCVTSAGSGPSVGKHLLMAYLPVSRAVAGTKLAVEYLGERYPVTVAVAGSAPLFDPAGERIRS